MILDHMQFVHKNEGFALITALLLMGFLMTLIASISLLLRADFQFQDKKLAIKQAKANARIGLQIALGELQGKLGPDINCELPLDKQGEIIGKNGKREGYYSYAFEDLTLSNNYSKALGVLSDTAEGGLRRNLMAYLKEGKGLGDEDCIIKGLRFSPKWAVVKSFYETCKRRSNQSIRPIGVHQDEILDRKHKEIVNEVNDPVTKTHGVGPIILGIKFGLRPNLERDPDSGFKNKMQVQYFVSLELWNPYQYDLNLEEYLFEISSRGIYDNIIYLNGDKKCLLDFDRSVIHKTDKAFFRCIIKSEFKAGEIKVFSISPHESNLNIKDGNLLITDSSINNFVNIVINSPIQGGGRQDNDKPNFVKKAEVKRVPEVKEVAQVPSIPKQQVPVEKEISRMRGGGKAPPRINMFLKQEAPVVVLPVKEETIVPVKVTIKELELETVSRPPSTRNIPTINSIQWGGDRNPQLTFVLTLKNDPSLIFQEIKELKIDSWRSVENPNVVNNPEDNPLFVVVFENKVSKESLQKFNPRSQCIWVDDNNITDIKKLDNPYTAKFWVKDKHNNYEELFKKRYKINDVKLFSLPSNFHTLSILRHCNMGLHENGPALALGNSFRNVYIAADTDKNSVPYLYDLAYHLNKALWDKYFFFMEKERRFFELKGFNEFLFNDCKKCANGLLIREVMNVNSTSKEAWAEVLSDLMGPPCLLTKSQITQLAKEVVNQVKERGPFRSLGDFVNRRLDCSIYGECGLIQAALNKVGLPIYQYNVLDCIGDGIAVRSDSFVIRAYGEAVHPFSGKKIGSASCEAVVQRVPEYLDANQNAPEDESEKLTKINKRFGRRFKIVSFRWLKGGEGQTILKHNR